MPPVQLDLALWLQLSQFKSIMSGQQLWGNAISGCEHTELPLLSFSCMEYEMTAGAWAANICFCVLFCLILALFLWQMTFILLICLFISHSFFFAIGRTASIQEFWFSNCSSFPTPPNFSFSLFLFFNLLLLSHFLENVLHFIPQPFY